MLTDPSVDIDTLVVGAGVIGLAIGRELARKGRSVYVIERHRKAGQETSSRNSGVIHSGIYYPTGSLKAHLCVAGRHLLYNYCQLHSIAHRRCGKLIVAQDSQLSSLEKLQQKAIDNNVSDLVWLSAETVKSIEPNVRCAAALLSPSTGIIDVHDYLTALMADIEQNDGTLIFNTGFVAAEVTGNGFSVTIEDSSGLSKLTCSTLINCTGLNATAFLTKVSGYPSTHLRQGYFAKGNYFAYQGANPFRHLVYPMPNEAGLGVHATLDLDGSTRFGPDVEWVNEIDYSVASDRSNDFYSAIREYWPDLPDRSLQPAYSGIRPKLAGPADPAADFVIESERNHGVSGFINLLGIESPGLTSSLAIGEMVAAMLA